MLHYVTVNLSFSLVLQAPWGQICVSVGELIVRCLVVTETWPPCYCYRSCWSRSVGRRSSSSSASTSAGRTTTGRTWGSRSWRPEPPSSAGTGRPPSRGGWRNWRPRISAVIRTGGSWCDEFSSIPGNIIIVYWWWQELSSLMKWK